MSLNDLQIKRPKIEHLLAANEMLDNKWTVLASNDDPDNHYVIDGEDGCVAVVNGEDSQFFLDLEECEALVQVRTSQPELLRYVLHLEKIVTRLERRLERHEDQ
jgi:hypothetical protein